MINEERIITDAMGFRLDVTILVGDFDSLGQHHTFENQDTGKVDSKTPHKIKIRTGLDESTACMVAAHEAYHLFFSIRHLITCGEEAEAEVFGELVKKIYEAQFI